MSYFKMYKVEYVVCLHKTRYHRETFRFILKFENTFKQASNSWVAEESV